MNEQELHIYIDNYLNNRLTPDELILFNDKLNSNTAFRNKVEAVKIANNVIRLGALYDIKTQLQGIHNQHKKKNFRRKILIVSASVLFVVISVLGTIYMSNKNRGKSILPKQKNHLKIDNTEENKIDQSINKTLSLTKQNDLQKTTKKQIVDVISDTVTNITDTINLKEDEINFNQKPLNDTLLKNNTRMLENHNDNSEIDDRAKSDPCELTKNTKLNYDLTLPILGKEVGEFRFIEDSYQDVYFIEYSLDGGQTFIQINEQKQVNCGIYELVVKDENGCYTDLKKLNVKYKNNNFIVQPTYGKYWELDLSSFIDFDVKLEIRNAKTAQLVYEKEINPNDVFIWQGKDQSNSTLPMGNYVYTFVSDKKGLIAQGQIAVIN